eukprot:3519193-Rhodomonas_salina.2
MWTLRALAWGKSTKKRTGGQRATGRREEGRPELAAAWSGTAGTAAAADTAAAASVPHKLGHFWTANSAHSDTSSAPCLSIPLIGRESMPFSLPGNGYTNSLCDDRYCYKFPHLSRHCWQQHTFMGRTESSACKAGLDLHGHAGVRH